MTVAEAPVVLSRWRIAGVVLALVFGLPAAHLVARFAAPEPGLAAVAAEAYPGTAVDTVRDRFELGEPGWLRFMMARDDDARWWRIAPREHVTGDVAAYRQQARARLSAAGWAIGEGMPSSLAFSAAKGDVRFDFYADDIDGRLETSAVVSALQPWWATLVALIGGLAAGALGWLLADWIVRRMAARPPRTRALVREVAVVAFVLTIPLLVQTFLQVVASATRSGPLSLPVGDLILGYARWPAAVAVLLLAAILALAASRPPETPTRPTAAR
jgi:hypothetical protein